MTKSAEELSAEEMLIEHLNWAADCYGRVSMPTILKAAHTAMEQARQEEREACEAAWQAIEEIQNWADAYPIENFPEPEKMDWAKAERALWYCGLSLSRISASNMRHVITGVQNIIAKAIRARGEALPNQPANYDSSDNKQE